MALANDGYAFKVVDGEKTWIVRIVNNYAGVDFERKD